MAIKKFVHLQKQLIMKDIVDCASAVLEEKMIPSEKRIADVLANIIMNCGVSGQDIRELSSIGIPVFELMTHSLDVGLFIRRIVDWEISNKKHKR